MFEHEQEDDLNIRGFVNAALAGKRAGGKGSSGEVAALKLARKVKELSALMQNIDRGLQEGFCCCLVAAAWPDSRALVLKLLPS